MLSLKHNELCHDNWSTSLMPTEIAGAVVLLGHTSATPGASGVQSCVKAALGIMPWLVVCICKQRKPSTCRCVSPVLESGGLPLQGISTVCLHSRSGNFHSSSLLCIWICASHIRAWHGARQPHMHAEGIPWSSFLLAWHTSTLQESPMGCISRCCSPTPACLQAENLTCRCMPHVQMRHPRGCHLAGSSSWSSCLGQLQNMGSHGLPEFSCHKSTDIGHRKGAQIMARVIPVTKCRHLWFDKRLRHLFAQVLCCCKTCHGGTIVMSVCSLSLALPQLHC